MQEDFEEELHGFEGEQWGSVVANRLSREDYKKLTANEGVGGEWGGGNGERGVLEDFEDELHGFQGEQRGSVVANRLPREDYKKLTANEVVGGEWGGGNGERDVLEDFEEELHGFEAGIYMVFLAFEQPGPVRYNLGYTFK